MMMSLRFMRRIDFKSFMLVKYQLLKNNLGSFALSMTILYLTRFNFIRKSHSMRGKV